LFHYKRKQAAVLLNKNGSLFLYINIEPQSQKLLLDFLESLHKAINLTSSVHDALLTGIKRMAV
jgi:hypothetical protein